MPRPLVLLRDAENHWLNNPIPTAQGAFLIRDQAMLFAQVYARMALQRGIEALPPTPANRDSSAEPVTVEISANRWVARCPDCNGAEFVWPDDPWFLCASCFNATLGGKWRPVLWPGDEELQAVENVLHARDNPFTRNWEPDREDVADLRAQNEERGEPIDPGEDFPPEERPKRITRSRTAAQKSGAAWRAKVQKNPNLPRPRRADPGVVLAAASGEGESSPPGSGILYPDVPPPVVPEGLPGEYLRHGV